MFEKITDNVEIHQTLPDTPNMTTQELKITWDKGCKIIKEAFNKLIEKLNDLKIEKTVLYEDSVGTTGEVTLLESAGNFDYLEIFFCDGDNRVYSTRINAPNGKHSRLSIIQGGASQLYVSTAGISIEGTNITFDYNRRFSGWTTIIEENTFKILKVIGYK